MQTLPILGVAVVAACASSYVFVSAFQKEPLVAPPAAAPDVDLEAKVAALQAEQAELLATIERLQAKGAAPMRSEVPAISDEQVTRAVESMLAERGLELPQLLAEASGGGKKSPALDFDATFALLSATEMPHEEQEALWSKVRDAGMIDDMVAAFEQRAEDNSNVASVHAQLGNAYLQKLFGVAADNEKGKWSIKADRAFDEALDINPKHWGARFAKAISLSFWPAPFGRGPEAVKHFEILVEQQEASGTSNPGHAQTYMFLGNMYQQQGNAEKAMATWQRGYNLHPGNEELGKKVKQ